VENGVKNIIVNPGSISTASKDRVKTDKIDARKLALHLSAGMLKGIRIPSEEEEAKRVLTRTREQLVRARSRTKIQIAMKLHQFSLLTAADTRELTLGRVLQAIATPGIKPEIKLSVERLVELWRVYSAQIRILCKEIRLQGQADSLEDTYRSIPGFGPLTARIVSNELGDMSQFSNERKLFSYVGLTPSESSSGETEHKGHITRQGSSRLRNVLVEAAWMAIRSNTPLRRKFTRVAKRAGKKRAIVAIARKLIGLARAIALRGEQYELKRAA
jgi:transposase